MFYLKVWNKINLLNIDSSLSFLQVEAIHLATLVLLIIET